MRNLFERSMQMKTMIMIKVRGYHIDGFGHVNHARYMEFLEEARWAYCEENGIFERLFSAKRISHAVVGMTINFRRSATIGDSLRIVTGVSKMGKKSYTMRQQIYLKDPDILIADADVTNVLLNPAGKIMLIDDEITLLWPDLKELS